MDKKRLHHIWTKIRPIKVWHLLIPFVLSVSVTVMALRQNNLTMVKLRQEVYAADQQNGDVEGALQRLRAHVHSHMNTDLTAGQDAVYPPIQLKYTYQRLQEAEKARVQQGSGAVYTEAQAYCERLNSTDFSGRNRVPCIEQYVSTHGAKEKEIPAAMYKFDFVSPSWSPDLAGFSLILSILLFILLILRITAGRIFKHLTK
jgi:preprotein translocase subunit SecF